MRNPPGSTGDGCGNHGSGQGSRQAALIRLRRQSWLAGALIFSPWLSTVFSCWSLLRNESATILTLLPGLAVAVHIQTNLFRHLETNHCRLAEDRLFPTLGVANWITLLRAGAIVGLAGFLPMAIQPGHGPRDVLNWAPGIIYLGVSLADLLDGFAARRLGRETELGKRLDIETDAAGLLVASLLAVAFDRLPSIYLLVGLAYYPFILGIQMRQRRGLPIVPLQPRPYSRIIAGFQMGLVGMSLLPIFNPVFSFFAAIIFMTPLLIGFLRDWLVVSCRIKTDANQQSGLDFQVQSIMKKSLPWTLRLVILSGGIITFVDNGVYHTNLPWQLAHSLSCLLAGFGFMGRSASLFLALLLSVNQSPLGTTLLSMVTYSTAATLMLTGTGAMSLWAPEEMILYRRKRGQIHDV